jgi:ankyrin repeat protein
MTRPAALQSDEKLFWSAGKGKDVWEVFVAAATGDINSLKLLLDTDPSLIRCHYDYRTPMYFAVKEKQEEAVAFLLSRGANPVSSGTNDTLLQMAIDRGYTYIQSLIEKAIGTTSDAKEGALMAEAIRGRDIQKVKTLLDEKPERIHAHDEGSSQPVHWAVMTRQPGMIDLVLDRGADINAQRADGARPLQLTNGDYSYRGWRDVPKDTVATPNDIYLHLLSRGAYLDINMAAQKGNIERVKELLDADPSLVNRPDDYVTYYAGSGSAIKNAAGAGHYDIVKLLLDRGADPNIPEEGIAPRGHALHSAVVNGHKEIVKLLLEHGAYPSVQIESSADTLSAAIWNKDTEMVELLCSYGAARPVSLLAYSGDIMTAAAVFNANPKLADDAYALECAAGEGHHAFVRLMLSYEPGLAKKIAVGVRNQGPDQGIHSTALTEYLFANGMNARHTDWLGITPLHKFAKRGDITSAGLFLQHGADIHAVDEELYTTPLGYAAKAGKIDMVKFLLEKGADPSLPGDHPWSTPLLWAQRRGYTEIAELLQPQK